MSMVIDGANLDMEVNIGAALGVRNHIQKIVAMQNLEKLLRNYSGELVPVRGSNCYG